MRPLSPTGAALLRALRRRRGLLERLSGSREAVAIVNGIAARPEAALAPHLLFVFGELGEFAHVGARALAACVAVASPYELLELDELCRRVWWYNQPIERVTAGLRDLATLIQLSEDGVRLAGVLSFNPNGRVREKAVKHLATLADGRELPFLLIRVNDWVDAVARAAEKAVRQRMTSSYADGFVDNLPIVLRLEARRRRQNDTIVNDALRLLTKAENRSALARGLTSPDREVRRVLFRTALSSPELDRIELVERALEDSDTLVRVSAARLARRELSIDGLRRLTPRLQNDPYPAVRSEWVATVAERDLSGGDALLVDALVDRSRMVRETTRFALRQYRAFSEFRSFYRARIDQLCAGGSGPRVLASAIAGLAESGQPEDVDVPIRLLGDSRPTVRIACARAMALLDLEGSLPRLIEMLVDPSPAVTRAVRMIVEPRGGGVDPEQIRRLLTVIPYMHGRLDATLLAERLGRWDSITVLLESLGDESSEVRDAALAGVRCWSSSRRASYEKPTSPQLERLSSALTTRRRELDPALVRGIEAIVQFWK